MTSKIFLRSLLFAGLCAFALGLTQPAQAIVILSNLPGTPINIGSNLGLGTDGYTRVKAVGLTIGANDLSFTSLTGLFGNPDLEAREVSGGIFSDLGGFPDAQLVAFNPASVPAATLLLNPVQRTLTAVAPFTLLANTSYWFVLEGPAVPNRLFWNELAPNTAPTASAEVSYIGYSFSEHGGATWASSRFFNGVQIEASRVGVLPEPGTLALFGLGLLGLGIARRRVRARV